MERDDFELEDGEIRVVVEYGGELRRLVLQGDRASVSDAIQAAGLPFDARVMDQEGNGVSHEEKLADGAHLKASPKPQDGGK